MDFIRQCLTKMYAHEKEEDYFNVRVMIEAGRWLEQHDDAPNVSLVVECFDPHKPWFDPEHYQRTYHGGDGREQEI